MHFRLLLYAYGVSEGREVEKCCELDFPLNVEREATACPKLPKVENIIGVTYLTIMGYLNEVERELREKVMAAEPGNEEKAEELVKFIKEKLLESYHNGKAAQNSPPKRGRALAWRK